MGLKMQKCILYHGSSEIIREPQYGKGKCYNDYGRGFYCTEHLELAKEWACTLGVDGYANQYEINLADLNILRLSDEQYTILHWLALLMEHRQVRISTPVMKRGIEWLRQNFLLDIKGYDLIVGYRADDSYFSFARAFVNNEISLKQLSYAMRLGRLGEQFVLKSKKAFAAIQFVDYIIADNSKYYIKRKIRDDDARVAFQMEIDNDDLESLYMRDIIMEGVGANDARLR